MVVSIDITSNGYRQFQEVVRISLSEFTWLLLGTNRIHKYFFI
jgi:hypothetical protein